MTTATNAFGRAWVHGVIAFRHCAKRQTTKLRHRIIMNVRPNSDKKEHKHQPKCSRSQFGYCIPNVISTVSGMISWNLSHWQCSRAVLMLHLFVVSYINRIIATVCTPDESHATSVPIGTIVAWLSLYLRGALWIVVLLSFVGTD